MDPLEIRLKNAVKPGDPTMHGTPYGEIGLVECLEAAKVHPHYSAPLGENQGRGVACGYWGNYGGAVDGVGRDCGEDGSILVVEGNPDIGGSRASMAIMAAETLGVDYEDVTVTVADTSSIGFSMLTGGSRTTFATGKAVVQAAQEVIEILQRTRSQDVGMRHGPSRMALMAKRNALRAKRRGKDLTAGQIAGRSDDVRRTDFLAEATVNPLDFLPGYAVHICDIEVDPETGHSSVVRYTAVQDVGRAIHPDYVEGQMQGGAVQGIGWALNEAYLYSKDGTLDNPGFLDYRMPVASDLPMIDTVMIEKPNPAHPYGVKGVGEVPIVPPLSAVACAVGAVVGQPMRDLPLTPDRVYGTINAKG